MQRSKFKNFIYSYYLKIWDVDSECTQQLYGNTAHCSKSHGWNTYSYWRQFGTDFVMSVHVCGYAVGNRNQAGKRQKMYIFVYIRLFYPFLWLLYVDACSDNWGTNIHYRGLKTRYWKVLDIKNSAVSGRFNIELLYDEGMSYIMFCTRVLGGCTLGC
jgi:hypothetical protein